MYNYTYNKCRILPAKHAWDIILEHQCSSLRHDICRRTHLELDIIYQCIDIINDEDIE